MLSLFQTKLAELDTFLTGHEKDAFRHAEQVNWSEEKFYEDNDIYYLSDGGYSRLAWREGSTDLELTYNSTVRVQSRWNDCIGLRNEIRAMILVHMKMNGWY